MADTDTAKALDVLRDYDGVTKWYDQMPVDTSKQWDALVEVFAAAVKCRDIARDYEEFDGDKRGIAACLSDAERALDAAIANVCKETLP